MRQTPSPVDCGRRASDESTYSELEHVVFVKEVDVAICSFAGYRGRKRAECGPASVAALGCPWSVRNAKTGATPEVFSCRPHARSVER